MLAYFVSGLLVGLAIGISINNRQPAQKTKNSPADRVPDAADTKKIIGIFQKEDKISNNDVEKLLKISDATASRYLSRLEKRGLLQQHGRGRGTFYTKI
ncbi:MAG TPA: DUF977 family protein [Candidatus Saccharimonadales bacterium]|nr:DUF977 family protein [Candidatus Saccharimonadales bacterium]